jgi:predicted Zn-dependent protease
LERLAAAWNWPTELEEVLWSIVNKYPGEKGQAQTLGTLLYVTGKTRSLLTLFAQEIKKDPKNLDAKNNLAAVALLLNAEEQKPHELAREVYEKKADNPAYASTYAYSLYLQNKAADALKVMDGLASGQLEQPALAGYYAVMLAANGDKVKAKKYMDLAAKARILLPEEKELFQRVKL